VIIQETGLLSIKYTVPGIPLPGIPLPEYPVPGIPDPEYRTRNTGIPSLVFGQLLNHEMTNLNLLSDFPGVLYFL